MYQGLASHRAKENSVLPKFEILLKSKFSLLRLNPYVPLLSSYLLDDGERYESASKLEREHDTNPRRFSNHALDP
jgi:hypothetical protein